MNSQTKIDLLHAILIILNVVMVPIGVLFALIKYSDYESKQ